MKKKKPHDNELKKMCVFWNEIDTFQDLIQNIDKNMQQQHKWKT